MTVRVTMSMRYLKTLLSAGLVLATASVWAQSRLQLGDFSAGNVQGWERAEFDDIPQSRYAIVEKDGKQVLQADCKASASVFGLKKAIDLNATPVMHWSWRVDSVFSGIDEKTKAGDDYVARVYAVIDGGILKWRTRAINYVWASKVPKGAAFPNPYRDEAMMVVLKSGVQEAGQWHHESRNVKADFKRFYDRDADQIDGIALMTDCDNHGGNTRVWFGDIYFTAE